MGVTSQQSFNFRLIANGTQLDTFTDEVIKVSNNVTGLFDVGLLPSDFTRQITLPGTKKNNNFFNFVYDISVTNPFLFATNVKVPCYIDFDGIYVSQGYLQLNKVNVTANKWIDSYEVSIYGTLSSFSRDANRLFLTDLTTLTKYNHTSSLMNITASWSGALFGGDIVYPFADYGSDWRFEAGANSFGINGINSTLSVQDYKPAIRLTKLWDAIFEQLGFTYDPIFFQNNPWINNVYLLCNYGLKYPEYSDADLETFGLCKIGAISGSGTDLNLPNNTATQLLWQNTQYNPQNNIGTNASYSITKASAIQGNLNLNLRVSSSINNLPTSWSIQMYETGSGLNVGTFDLTEINQFFLNNQLSRQGSINTTFEVAQQFQIPYLPTGSYYFRLIQSRYNSGLAAPTVTVDPDSTNKSYLEVTKVLQAADGRVIDIAKNLPYGTTGIKLIDFVKGVQKKFNLIIQPSKTKLNHFEINTFNEWYRSGGIKNFNRYINLDDKIEVIPANNLAVNQLNFGDTLDTDYVSQQFFKGANREYGKQYYIDTQNFFSQGTFDVKTTFGNGPLVYVEGTGLSGSAGGINPPVVAYPVNGDGEAQLSNNGNPYNICSSANPIRIIYSTTGLIEASAVLYYDAYGQSLVTGYSYVTDRAGAGCPIWSLDPVTGIVGSDLGLTCAADGGGCI